MTAGGMAFFRRLPPDHVLQLLLLAQKPTDYSKISNAIASV
jgi:hypothetical protein